VDEERIQAIVAISVERGRANTPTLNYMRLDYSLAMQIIRHSKADNVAVESIDAHSLSRRRLVPGRGPSGLPKPDEERETLNALVVIVLLYTTL
jgi:hypothetical protein